MKIIVKDTVVIAISSQAQVVSNGIALDDYILGIPVNGDGQFTETLPDIVEVQDVTIPADFTSNKYKYENGQIILNPDYVPYISPEQRVKDLEQRQTLMQQAIDELILGGAL